MSISYMNYMAQQMSPKKFEKWQEDFCENKAKEYFVINDMGACDIKGNITANPHLYTKEGAELARETLEEYTGHNHYVVKLKTKDSVKEFCRDVYGTLGTREFKPTDVSIAMEISLSEAYEWLHNANYYNLVKQKNEKMFYYYFD